MLLIGQHGSPFVRRVGIALDLYGLSYQHEPYSVFRDAEKIAAYNPLRRVPTLVLDDGVALSETFVCLDVLDERVATETPDKRLLLPRTGLVRREGLRIGAMCSGVCEKNISLLYNRELALDAPTSWRERCALQVRQTLLALEALCARRPTCQRQCRLDAPSVPRLACPPERGRPCRLSPRVTSYRALQAR